MKQTLKTPSFTPCFHANGEPYSVKLLAFVLSTVNFDNDVVIVVEPMWLSDLCKTIKDCKGIIKSVETDLLNHVSQVKVKWQL